ncbi:hypothetical protein ADIAL_0873 [Alkalibacterium sp. AK22]|nr:hypothetical protein ADIAL_0873 [Alkalibacterium sp. AK22]
MLAAGTDPYFFAGLGNPVGKKAAGTTGKEDRTESVIEHKKDQLSQRLDVKTDSEDTLRFKREKLWRLY